MNYRYYFAYGSNMDFAQMKQRCPSAIIVDRAAILPLHRLAFTIYSKKRKSGCADIVPSKRGEIAGVVYKISETDLVRMDRFEGHPTHYKRTYINVTLSDRTILKCASYVVVNKMESLRPTKKYMSKIIRSAERYHFPEEYTLFLKSVLTSD